LIPLQLILKDMNTLPAKIDFTHPPGHYYTVRGRKLWVEQEGTGEPLVLLSGLGPAGSHVIFHPHFDALAADHRIVYVDLYGRGRSDKPDDLTEISFESDVADVAALLSELNLGPVHLYGFSYGGLLGQALALDHSHLVRTLVLANSLHSPEMWHLNHVNINREIANQYPEIWGKIQALRAEGISSTDPKMQELFAPAATLVRFYNPENARQIATEAGARNFQLYPLFCGEDVDFMIGNEVAKIPDFRPRLKQVTVPMLVIAGRFDRALYPALQYQFLTYAPHAEFHVLEHSGSFSHIEEPEELFRILRIFWQSL
jgi:proline iminopeptidase